MKIIISSHVEPSRSGDLRYLTEYVRKVRGLPIIHHLMFGENATDKLLKFFKQKSLLGDHTIGLHVHGHETKEAIAQFEKIFGFVPESISFGHWQVSSDDLRQIIKNGVKNNLSYAGYRNSEKYFVKASFTIERMKNIPVSGDPKYPINPLTTHMHFLLFIILTFILLPTKKTLHFSFHSYDLDKSIVRRIRFSLFCLVIKLFGTTDLNDA